MSVFGEPVNDGSRTGRAQKANDYPNEGDKRTRALSFLSYEKSKYGPATGTPCCFYNATGEDLTFNFAYNFDGKIYEKETYPKTIQNGQWGAFLHVNSNGNGGSSRAYVVYLGKDAHDGKCNQLLAWYNPGNSATGTKHSFCDIFYDGPLPDEIKKKLETSGPEYEVKKMGLITTTNIDQEDSFPHFEAILTLGSFVPDQ